MGGREYFFNIHKANAPEKMVTLYVLFGVRYQYEIPTTYLKVHIVKVYKFSDPYLFPKSPKIRVIRLFNKE